MDLSASGKTWAGGVDERRDVGGGKHAGGGAELVAVPGGVHLGGQQLRQALVAGAGRERASFLSLSSAARWSVNDFRASF